MEIMYSEYYNRKEKSYQIWFDDKSIRSSIWIWDRTDPDVEMFRVLSNTTILDNNDEISNNRVKLLIEYIRDKENNIKFKVVECYKEYMVIDGHKVLYDEMDNMCELVYGSIAQGILARIGK